MTIAADAIARGIRLIIVVGGDGTLHEVVNGMAPDFGAAVLGVVPHGTGNDAVRSLGIPVDPDEAVGRIRSGIAQSVDLIQITNDNETRYAVNVATGGMGGVVSDSMPGEMKDRWGPLAYARAAASALPNLPVYDMEIQRDDGPVERYRAVSLVVGNGPYAARGVCVAPGAVMDDGRLSVHLVTESGAGDLLALIPWIMRGEVPERDNYHYWQCERLAVRVSDPMGVSLDGEMVEGQDFLFRCIPSAIHVLGARIGKSTEGSTESKVGWRNT